MQKQYTICEYKDTLLPVNNRLFKYLLYIIIALTINLFKKRIIVK